MLTSRYQSSLFTVTMAVAFYLSDNNMKLTWFLSFIYRIVHLSMLGILIAPADGDIGDGLYLRKLKSVLDLFTHSHTK